MPSYLSDAWVTALDEAARASGSLAEATAGVHLVLEQVVTSVPVTDRTDEPDAVRGAAEVRWHVVVDDGTVRFHWGAATEPTVRFTTDAMTARAITDGRRSATEAFMAGELRVGGDTTALVVYHELFSGLGDLFAAVPVD